MTSCKFTTYTGSQIIAEFLSRLLCYCFPGDVSGHHDGGRRHRFGAVFSAEYNLQERSSRQRSESCLPQDAACQRQAMSY